MEPHRSTLSPHACLLLCATAAAAALHVGDPAHDPPYLHSFLAYAKAAAIDDNIILAVTNYGYRDFAHNWALSLHAANVTNYALVTLDGDAHRDLVDRGIACFLLAPDNAGQNWPDPSALLGLASAGGDAHHHESPRFMNLMHLRLRMLVAMLRHGMNVWVTDVDAYFRGDPFAPCTDDHDLYVVYDTPYLPESSDTPLMVMAGFFLARNCTASPLNCKLIEDTLAFQSANPDKHDQYAFNAVLAEMPALKYKLLDPLKFVNGAWAIYRRLYIGGCIYAPPVVRRCVTLQWAIYRHDLSYIGAMHCSGLCIGTACHTWVRCTSVGYVYTHYLSYIGALYFSGLYISTVCHV